MFYVNVLCSHAFFPSSILWIIILYHTFCPKTWINVLNFFRTVSSSFPLQRSEGNPRGTVIGWRPLAFNIANARTYFSNTSNPTVSNPTVQLFLEGHIKVGLWWHRWQFQIFVFKCRYCSWLMGAALYKSQNKPGDGGSSKLRSHWLSALINLPAQPITGGKTKATCLRYWVDIATTPALVSLFETGFSGRSVLLFLYNRHNLRDFSLFWRFLPCVFES